MGPLIFSNEHTHTQPWYQVHRVTSKSPVEEWSNVPHDMPQKTPASSGGKGGRWEPGYGCRGGGWPAPPVAQGTFQGPTGRPGSENPSLNQTLRIQGLQPISLRQRTSKQLFLWPLLNIQTTASGWRHWLWNHTATDWIFFIPPYRYGMGPLWTSVSSSVNWGTSTSRNSFKG